MGSYSRSNIEVCLLATKGKGLKVLNHSISQLMFSPRTTHSTKPDEARYKIEAVFGRPRRVELFGRKKAPGWCVVGNEIGDTVQDFIAKNFK
jgi:N6-adenosine-specific RNA methylase IME4